MRGLEKAWKKGIMSSKNIPKCQKLFPRAITFNFFLTMTETMEHIWVYILNNLLQILTVILIVIGYVLSRKFAQRGFLISEIYSPLYEEVKMMSENIAAFKNSFQKRYGRPEYSAPRPAQKTPGGVRIFLQLNGLYEKIPNDLRSRLDAFYEGCEKYDSLLKSSDEQDKAREKRKWLMSYYPHLLDELRDRIRNPNPLFKLRWPHG